jgi:DNA invertase Pin-like site-specific DNA recombinase
MTAYGYCRVSDKNEADQRTSLEVQERTVRGHAMILGHDNIAVYVDRGISGAVPMSERPEGRKLLPALQHGDILIVPKLDRAFRSALDALTVAGQLKERGVKIHILDLGGDVTEGMGKMMFTIAAAFAEGERDRIRERIKGAKASEKQKGKYLGGVVPFGYRVGEGGILVENTEELEALGQARLWRREGHSLRTVSRLLDRQGFKISHAALANRLKAA